MHVYAYVDVRVCTYMCKRIKLTDEVEVYGEGNNLELPLSGEMDPLICGVNNEGV